MTGPGGDPEIDDLLRRYEREIACFVETRDALEPLLRGLVPAIEAWFADRADPALLAGAARWRARYVTRMAVLDPLLQEWLAIRGSGRRLWEAQPFMSDEQDRLFAELQSREFRASADRDTFDALHERARVLLLLFEEARPGPGEDAGGWGDGRA